MRLCKNIFLILILVSLFLVDSAFAQIGITEQCYNKDQKRLVYGGRLYYAYIGSSNASIRKSVFLLDFDTIQEQTLWLTEQPSIGNIRISNSGDKVSFIEYQQRQEVSPEQANYITQALENGEMVNKYYYSNAILRVMTIQAQEVKNINYVREYVWSPDGNKIAYITGDSYDGGLGFKTTGTWIYDLTTDETKKIYDAGLAVFWAAFDNNLYIWYPDQPEVRRYNVGTDTLESTSYKDIYFSPDGQYYYSPGREGTEVDFYLTQTNASIKAGSAILSNLKVAFPLAWSPNSKSLLIPRTEVDPATNSNVDVMLIYNVETDSAKETFEKVIGWGDTSEEVIVYSNGQMVKKNVADLVLK